MPASRGRGRADHVMRSAARGAVLIGLAIVVGIILLRVVDKGSPSPGGTTAPITPSTTVTTGTTATTKAGTTATTKAGTTTTKAGTTGSTKTVRVYVQNGSGVSGAAQTKSNELKGKGYVPAGTGNAATQANNTVACKAGFEKQLATLITDVGNKAVQAAFPSTVPSGAENADCIVTLGKN